MKLFHRLFTSFQTKVTMVLVLSLFFCAGLSNYLIYQFSLDSQLEQLRDKLAMLAQTAALMVDADELKQVPLNREGVFSLQYKSIAEKLNQIKLANPTLQYIYTLAPTEKEGIWQFIVDPNPASAKKEVTSYPGDKYIASRFPEMLEGLKSSSADKQLMVDEWGVTLSGYAPIRDKAGNTVAVLGVDISAEDVYLVQEEVRLRAAFVLMVGFFLSISLGLLVSRRISKPIKRLIEGTRRVATGDLQFKVAEKGDDEIGELARSFNQMAQKLFESRQKLHDYFYRVMQSLIRILEAKDTYTRGHSDRVADYAEQIALSMGFSKEKAELLKRTAELHDIGKLAIPESILTKKERLTDEEWKIIQEHPVVGEDILKPAMLDEEMLVVIRSHHERYDGKGYPDKIIGDNINIFSQIIAVADAYDAMTSPRAYRPAMSQQKAVEELRKNAGTQFNTHVVEVFLKLLQSRAV